MKLSKTCPKCGWGNGTLGFIEIDGEELIKLVCGECGYVSFSKPLDGMTPEEKQQLE